MDEFCKDIRMDYEGFGCGCVVANKCFLRVFLSCVFRHFLHMEL